MTRCCVPKDGADHCDHHPEWHDERGCNHPRCDMRRENEADRMLRLSKEARDW